MIVTTNQGTELKKNKLPVDVKIIKLKLPKIFNNAWPDIIFANKRIARLSKRAKYETISIIISNGAMASGDPTGLKIPKNGKNPVL